MPPSVSNKYQCRPETSEYRRSRHTHPAGGGRCGGIRSLIEKKCIDAKIQAGEVLKQRDGADEQSNTAEGPDHPTVGRIKSSYQNSGPDRRYGKGRIKLDRNAVEVPVDQARNIQHPPDHGACAPE